MTESWECPKCQTLNAFGDQCYSCGAPRPDAPAQAPSPAAAADVPTNVNAATNSDADWTLPPPLDPPPLDPTEPVDTEPVDTEPHPCWCSLVKGPHDTRDHPPTAESDDDLEADAHLDQLEAELGLVTNDWVDPTVKRTYDFGDDGEQLYEDEAMLFEEHGYSKWVDRPNHVINATYTIGDGLPDTQ